MADDMARVDRREHLLDTSGTERLRSCLRSARIGHLNFPFPGRVDRQARSPARSRRRQNRRNKSPRRVGQVGVVESSAHRTGPFDPDQRSFKTDVNFSNTLLDRFSVPNPECVKIQSTFSEQALGEDLMKVYSRL